MNGKSVTTLIMSTLLSSMVGSFELSIQSTYAFEDNENSQHSIDRTIDVMQNIDDTLIKVFVMYSTPNVYAIPTIGIEQEQLHGLGASKSCNNVFVGQQNDCFFRAVNIDDFGDTITVIDACDQILGVVHCVSDIPNLGTSIFAVADGTSCAAGNSALPCTLPVGGSVTFHDTSFTMNIAANVTDQATIFWTDDCNSPTTQNCSRAPQSSSAGASTEVQGRQSQVVTKSSKNGQLNPGTSVFDKAIVSGLGPSPIPSPTGTVSFFLCGPNSVLGLCTVGGTPDANNPITCIPSDPSDGTCSASSSTVSPTALGFYCWRAEYSGNANYTSSSHTNSVIDQGGECFRVSQQLGTIIIKKNTVPNDTTLFDFTPTGFGSGKLFELEDDGDEGDGKRSTKSFGSITPGGTYSILEGKNSDYKQTADCDDDASTTPSVVIGRSIEINVDPGETVTCTFKNEKIDGPSEPPILCGDGTVASAQPEDAISMTSIRNGNIVKTIHAEKQIFDCELPQGEIQVIADVTIIAEIYENIDTKTILSKQAVAITCIKEPDRARILECDTSTPTTDRIPVTNCIESDVQHPQEMNSMQKGNTAKTIETQKEVFECSMNTPSDPTDDKKVDLLLFTELFQNLNTQITQDPQIMSMKCVIKIDTVTVEACRFTNHPV